MSGELERCPNGTMWKPSCKRRSCAFCGPRWARDWGRVLGVNLEHLGGPVATIAITGPGANRLPWDETHCAHRRAHKHSGKDGCRAQGRAVAHWCETLSWRWQGLRQAARIATKRELGYAPPWLLARVWEPQKRGVPHLHLVVPYGSADERQAADVFRKHLARLAGSYDFGRVQPKLNPVQGRDAARYLASYLTGRNSRKQKSSIRENIAATRAGPGGEQMPILPRSLLWLTPKLTRETFVTMRTLRRARHLWAAMDGRCELPMFTGWEEALRVTTVFRRIYPQRAGPLPDGWDAEGELDRARFTDEYEARNRMRPHFWETDRLRERALRMGRWGFQATARGLSETAIAVAA